MRSWLTAGLVGVALAACAAAPAPSCPAPTPCPACEAPVLAASSSAVAPAALASSAPATVAPVASTPRQRPTARLFDEASAAGFFPRGDAFALGVDGQALDELVAEAERTRSDALLVLKGGQLIVERYFGSKRGPIETMSITKSFTALAVMMLVEQGKISSLDVPVSRFIPEFARGKRAAVTLRHLLTQTSGLAHVNDARALNAQKDRTAFARKAEVTEEPGAVFSYNNTASQLLSEIVEQAAGKPVDAYLDEKLFRPLGIRGWQWARDEGKNAQTYYGLALDAQSLARVGQLLLDDGAAGGKQLLGRASIDKIHTPSEKNPSYGLLWWIRYERVVHELDAEEAGKAGAPGALGALAGRKFGSSEAFWLEAGSRLTADEREAAARLAGGGRLVRSRPDHPVGFHADGSLGQRLAVFPGQGLVAVRQRRRRPSAEESDALSFPAMLKLVQALTPVAP